MLSVIVPVFNEKKIVNAAVGNLVQMFRQSSLEENQYEIIFSDCSSSDGTIDDLQRLKSTLNFKLLINDFAESSVGQAVLSAVTQCQHRYILVVPLDCLLEPKAIEQLKRTLSHDHQKLWGAFFKMYHPSFLWLDVYAWLQNKIRAKMLRNVVWTNGIFFNRDLVKDFTFQRNYFLEDIILCDHLKQSSKNFVFLESKIIASSRRYLTSSIFMQSVKNVIILCLYRLNLLSPQKLKRFYQ